MKRVREPIVLSIEDIPQPAVIGSFRVMREVNQAYCDLYRYERQQLIGSSFRMIYLDNSEFVRSGVMWKRHLDRNLEYVDERIMIRSDQTMFWCQVRGRTLNPSDPVSLVLWLVYPLARPVATAGIELTRRQRQIVALVAQGKSNSEIAAETGMSVRTAEAHRYRIMRKVRVKNTAELVSWFAGSRRQQDRQ